MCTYKKYIDETLDGLKNKSEFEVCKNVLENAANIFSSIPLNENNYDTIGLDWAGIGDACYHSRLILQHKVKEGKRVAWIVTPLVASLFKDDKIMDVFSGFYSPFRGPGCPIGTPVWKCFDRMFEDRFPKQEKIHISKNVCLRYHQGGWCNFSELFFSACGIKRDLSIEYKLTHNGEPILLLPEKFVFLEYSSRTFGATSLDDCVKLIISLEKIGISTVYVGDSNDKKIPVGVDARGLSLYDTFSIAKRSIAIIGRCSGNEALSCYLPHIPVLETNIHMSIDKNGCNLHPNVTRLGPDFPERIPLILKDLKK